MKNYYETLGVSKDSNPKDIKKAYRTLSMKYHPDHNNDNDATQKMAEINDAYETLSDDDKRRDYDMKLNPAHPHHTHATHTAHTEHTEHNMHDIFNLFKGNLFGGGMSGMSGMNGMFPGETSMEFNINGNNIHVFRSGNGGTFQRVFTQVQKPGPIVKTVSITMEESYKGCEVELSFNRWSIINNTQKVTEEVREKFSIPAGVRDQEQFVLQNRGNSINDTVKGDIHVIVSVNNTSKFQRRGNDLYMKVTIPLRDALCGFSLQFNHLSGHNYTLNNSESRTIIRPGYTKILPNMGMVVGGVGGNTGNMVIEFDVKFPDSLDDSHIEGLKNILPID